MNGQKDSIVRAFLPLFAVVFTIVGFLAGYVMMGNHPEGSDKVITALKMIQDRYPDEVPLDEVVDEAMRGMTARLDPFCAYFNTEEWREFNDVQLKGEFGGIGILIEVDRPTGFLRIITPIEDTPAFEADVLPGDLVTEVDGKTIKGVPLRDIISRIKGEPGTEVALTLLREGRDSFRVTLTRAIIKIKKVKARMLEDGIGYIRISDFTKMIDDFDRKVEELRVQGLRALIIDLRFNGGGYYDQSVALSDRFLDGGVIVTTRGRSSADNREDSATKESTLPPWPLAVLVNGASASASEIFAGAMKDHGRGTLVGGRTFGKGLVQSTFVLSDKSCFKMTTSKYYTPKGYCVQREEGKKEYGLDPDYRVDLSREEEGQLMKAWRDERVIKGQPPKEPSEFKDLQLEAALEVVRARLEGRDPSVETRVLETPRGEPPKE